jgi:hypothetical protein
VISSTRCCSCSIPIAIALTPSRAGVTTWAWAGNPHGEGIIGVAVFASAPIRIGYAVVSYVHAARKSFAQSAGDATFEIEIPSRAAERRQPARGSRSGGPALGVLYVESPKEQRFSYGIYDALVCWPTAPLFVELLSQSAEQAGDAVAALPTPVTGGASAAKGSGGDPAFRGGQQRSWTTSTIKASRARSSGAARAGGGRAHRVHQP